MTSPHAAPSRGKSPRRAALDILVHTENENGFSNLVLDASLERAGFGRQDAAFVTALVYGVLEKRIALDWLIARFARRNMEKIEPAVRDILRLGAYQMLYMDRVPDAAAVSESVALAKAAHHAYAAGFVNAVLRSLGRSRGSLPWPDPETDRLRYLSVRYSCPEWLVHRWRADYGEDTAAELIAALSLRAPAAARVNTLRTTAEDLVRTLHAQGMEAGVSGRLPDAVELEGAAGLRSLPAFSQGLFFMQDYASQLCCLAVGAQPGETVFDMCAAPGGKSFTLALRMRGEGRVLSMELHPRRVELIAEGARRLGLKNIQAVQNDSSKPSRELGEADRVLCDVPCSGLGVIRRKPEIRYKSPETFDSLPDLQYSILYEGSRHVRVGGTLVYSTCTLSPAENEAVVRRFLNENSDFSGEMLPEEYFSVEPDHNWYCTLFPHVSGTDGFFIARFRRDR